MAFRERYDFDGLVNEAERLVVEELERQTAGLEERWRTEDCILDMAAYALNKVAPRYRATLMGHIYASAMDDSPYAEEVRRAVADAITTVMQNPPA